MHTIVWILLALTILFAFPAMTQAQTPTQTSTQTSTQTPAQTPESVPDAHWFFRTLYNPGQQTVSWTRSPAAACSSNSKPWLWGYHTHGTPGVLESCSTSHPFGSPGCSCSHLGLDDEGNPGSRSYRQHLNAQCVRGYPGTGTSAQNVVSARLCDAYQYEPHTCTKGEIVYAGYYRLNTQTLKPDILSSCIDNCVAVFKENDGHGISVERRLNNGIYRLYTRSYYAKTGETCVVNDADAPRVAAIERVIRQPLSSLPDPFCAKGQTRGEFNGVDICVDNATGKAVNSNPPQVTQETTTETATNPDGSTTTTETTTHSDGSKTITRTITAAGGDKTSTTETTPGTFDVSGNTPPRSASGDDCAKTLQCQGDPIACLSLKINKEQACEQAKRSGQPVAVEINTGDLDKHFKAQAEHNENQTDLQEQLLGKESNEGYDITGALSGWVSDMTEQYGSPDDLAEGGALDTEVDLTDLVVTDKTIPATCPADYTFAWRGQTFTIPFSVWCDVFELIGALVLITAALMVMRIVIGAF